MDIAAGARIVLVGSRGTPRDQGMLDRSTSRALIEFASCPVLVIGCGPTLGSLGGPARDVRPWPEGPMSARIGR